jgi:hypothetical protein
MQRLLPFGTFFFLASVIAGPARAEAPPAAAGEPSATFAEAHARTVLARPGHPDLLCAQGAGDVVARMSTADCALLAGVAASTGGTVWFSDLARSHPAVWRALSAQGRRTIDEFSVLVIAPVAR